MGAQAQGVVFLAFVGDPHFEKANFGINGKAEGGFGNGAHLLL